MPMKYIKTALLCLFVFSVQVSFSQNSISDSIQHEHAAKNAREFYRASMKENLLLFNGSEYGSIGHNSFGSPFFESDSLLNGSILFMNNWYEDLNFQYDLMIDKLVMYDYKKSYSVTLAGEQIKEFIINGHHFYRLENIASSNTAGFYENLVEGVNKLWARREKKVVLSSNAEDRTSRFTQYNSYFIQKNRLFYPVADENSLLKTMEDKKDDIKKYIRKNKIKFRKQFESAAVKVLVYYNQLMP